MIKAYIIKNQATRFMHEGKYTVKLNFKAYYVIQNPVRLNVR